MEKKVGSPYQDGFTNFLLELIFVLTLPSPWIIDINRVIYKKAWSLHQRCDHLSEIYFSKSSSDGPHNNGAISYQGHNLYWEIVFLRHFSPLYKSSNFVCAFVYLCMCVFMPVGSPKSAHRGHRDVLGALLDHSSPCSLQTEAPVNRKQGWQITSPRDKPISTHYSFVVTSTGHHPPLCCGFVVLNSGPHAE